MENIDQALSLITRFEGCRLKAYKDIVGVLTIGWGTTEGVTEGMEITQDEADHRLLEHCQVLREKIIGHVHVELSNNSLCALISFAYNLGFGSLYHSTLLTLINASAPLDACAAEFLKWDHAGGRQVPGLTARRQAEAGLFLA